MLRAVGTLLVCALVVVVGVWFFGLSSCKNPPKNDSEASESKQPHQNKCTSPYATFKVGLFDVWTVSHESHEEIIAISTVIIALFTVVLGLFTVSLSVSTRHLVRNAVNTERRQLRSYMGVQKIELIFRNNVKQNVGVERGSVGWIWPDVLLVNYKNFGITPASEVYIHVNWIDLPYGMILPDDFGYIDKNDAIFEGTEPNYSYEIVDGGQGKITTVNIPNANIFKEAKSRKKFVYIYGHIDYTDIYKCRWQRSFCFLYEPWGPRSDPFVAHSQHNDEKKIG